MRLDVEHLAVDPRTFIGYIRSGEFAGEYVRGSELAVVGKKPRDPHVLIDLEFSSFSSRRGTARDPWLTFDLSVAHGRELLDSFAVDVAPPKVSRLVEAALFPVDESVDDSSPTTGWFRSVDAFVTAANAAVADSRGRISRGTTLEELFDLMSERALVPAIAVAFDTPPVPDPWRRWGTDQEAQP